MVRSMIFALALVGCTADRKPAEGEPDPGVDDADADGDGFTVPEGDCDDADGEVFPTADEICNGVDDDCDGQLDEDSLATWYGDADADGYGDPDAPDGGCENPGLPTAGDDCDDGDADVNPGANEACDGIDNDCDGQIDEGVGIVWYADADEDGYGDVTAALTACEAPDGYVADGTDCDDTLADAFPGSEEACDEVDNDCDGTVDEGVTTTWYVDVDGDGYGTETAPLEACALPTGYSALSTDCDDVDPAVSPAAVELCNGVDDDCDGSTDDPASADAGSWYDDADGDGYGDPDVATIACEAPAGSVANDSDCDDTDATLNPDTVWYIDYDSDTWGSTTYTLAQCERPVGYVADAADCDDLDAAVNPDAAELCNGIDDDCDGRTDDDDVPVSGTSVWYADADGDTFGNPIVYTDSCDAPAGFVADSTDCDDFDAAVYPGAPETWYDGIDGDCDGADDPSVCDDVPGGTTVAWDDTCAYSYASSGWTVATEWTTDSTTYYAAGNTYDDLMMTPVAGNLTDDNGDGRIDDDDVPDLAYTTFTGSSYSAAGYLRVVSGDGTGEHFSVYSVSSGAVTYTLVGDGGVAIGDLEGDGSPDIVTMTSAGDVIALEADGTFKWVYDTALSVTAYPTIADMDGDGAAEVAVGPTVLSSTGALLGTCAYGSAAYMSIAADIDLDGTAELVVGSALCEMNGTLVWNSGVTAGYSGVGNFDADDYGETINVASAVVTLVDDDGAVLWSRTLTGAGGGPPTVADFDGDGRPEIGVATSTRFTMLETDGTIRWAVVTDDSSSMSTGASAFDFDGDGDAEVVYADENELYIFDGSTGTELYNNTDHVSGTIREYPFVADVDRDGQAEIVVASAEYAGSGWTGVHVLGETNGEWASARCTMNQHAYGISAIEDDLSVPTAPGAAWLGEWGSTRAQRSWSDAPDGAADLSAALLGVCEDCAPGELDVYVAVENVGAVFVPDGVSVRLYALNGSVETLLEEQLTPEPCDPGERQAPLRFVVDVADVGADGLLVEIDRGDDVRECDESNNAVSWDAMTCVP